MALELAMCIDAVEKLHFIWEQSNDEDRQGFVRNLFEWVEYDLDARRITNFRLKSWADRFIILRGALYEEDKRDDLGDDSDDDGSPSEGKKELAPPSQEVKQAVPHRGLEIPSFPKLLFAMVFATAISYYGQVLPQTPISNSTPAKCARNAEIRARYKRGESRATLAEVFGITEQRIHQIIRGRRK